MCSTVVTSLLQFTVVYSAIYRDDFLEPWSITGLLGGNITKACQVAHRSVIIVLQSQPLLELKPSIELSSMNNWDQRRVLAVYSPSNRYANDLIITSLTKRSNFATIIQDGISVMKYATGKGDIEGGVRIELCSNLNSPTHAVLLDSAPWHAEMLYSSLLVTQNPDYDSDSPVTVIPGSLL